MISAVRIATSRIARVNAPRAFTAIGSTRSMGDSFSSKVSQRDCVSRLRNANDRPSRAHLRPPVHAAFTDYSHSHDLTVARFINAKERIEEARYIRAREQQIAAAKAAAAAAESHVKELESVDAATMAAKSALMNDIADMLATTGDVVSEAGLANLARWKIKA